MASRAKTISSKLIGAGVLDLLGAAVSGSADIRAGNAAYRLSLVNADSILKTADANAKLIETGVEENVKIGQFNADMLEAQARDAIYRGQEDELRFRRTIHGAIGAQRASLAAQGLDLGAGTALDIQTDTAYQGELDARTININSQREAWGFKVQAEDERNQIQAIKRIGALHASNVRETGRTEAMSERMQGGYARSAGRSRGISTILTTAADVINQAYGFKRKSR